MVGGSLTRVRNNQVYNSDIYASAKLVAKSVTGGLLSDNFTYAGNMTIGNLTVNGNTTTLDTTNLVVADPLLAINRNQSGTPTYDLGFIMGRGNQTNVAMIWEETAKQFQLQYTSESTASTTYGIINNSGFANLQAYGILLNNATVGTLTVTSSSQAPSYTTTNGGQFTGYFTGAIGANTANSGAFTTLSTTGNATIQGNILVTGNIIPSTSNIYSLGSSANRFANLWIKGTTIYLGSIAVSDGGGYLQVTDPNTGLQLGIQTASINNTVIGNTGPAAATFTTATVNGTLYAATVNAGTIGNSGATFSGTSINLTGNASVNAISAYQVGNTNTILEGTIGSATPSQPNITSVGTLTSLTVSGTVAASTVNAGTIGNASATFNGASINLTGNASVNAISAYQVGNTSTILEGTIGSATPSQPNITSVGTLTSLTTSGNLTASGNITAQTANIYAANIIGNTSLYGAQYYWTNGATLASTITGTYSNSNVTAYLPTYSGTLSPSSLTTNNGGQISGYLTGAIGANAANSGAFTTVSATNNITATTANIYAANVIGNTAAYGAQYYWTNGATLASTITGTYSNSNVTAYLPTYSGTLSPSSLTTNNGGQISGYLTGAIGANAANSAVFTTVNASGNITAQTANVYAANFVANTASYSPVYYYPNGVNILSAITSSAYSNANAAAYLTTYTGNLLAGNITALNNITGYLNGVIGANAANSATFTTTSITSATNTSGLGTGALVITQGGASIQQDLYVGGNVYAANIISQTSQQLVVSDPLLYLSANAGSYNYEIGFYSHFVGGNVPQYAHTGLTRNHVDNQWYLFSNIPEPSGGTINLTYSGIVYDTLKLGAALIQNTTTASSTTSGALQVAGGAGIAGALYAGSIQNTPIGSVTPSSGVFTGVTSTGQVTGYLTGAIGANTANSGTFTTLTASTVSTSGNITAQTANVYAANLIGNTALYSAQFYWTNGATLASTITGSFSNSNVNSYLSTYTGTLSPSSLTTNNGGQVIAYLTGAIGANNANTGTFTTANVNGTLYAATVNAGTIGNSGAVFNGASINLTGNASINAINAFQIGNTNTILEGTIGSATPSQPNITSVGTLTSLTVSGTAAASSINAGTIGNSGAVFNGASINLTGNASINAINAFQIGNTNTILEGTIASATPSQPNITSVGTLTSLTTSGNITAQTANVYAAYTVANTGAVATNFFYSNGTSIANTIAASTYSNTNAGAYLTVYNGNIKAAYITAVQVGNTGTLLTGTLTTNAQPYITSVGTLGSLTVSTTISGSVSGNAGSATQLQNSRNINGVPFNGTSDITITVDANNLTGTTLASGVTASSLQSVGFLNSLSVNGNINTCNSVITNSVTAGVYTQNISTYDGTGNLNVYIPQNANLTVNAGQVAANLVVHGNSAAAYQNLLVTNGATGQVGIKVAPNAITTGASLEVNSTDSIQIPVGTTAQRPSGAAGMIRYNTTNAQFEYYNSSTATWVGAQGAYTTITENSFTGDNSTTVFTLSQNGTTNGTFVSVNGVLQIPTTAYSVSGTTLTFTEAPTSTDIIDARVVAATTTVTGISGSTGGSAAIQANSSVYITGGIAAAVNPTTLVQNTPTTIDTFPTTTYRVAKYVIKVSDSTNGVYCGAELIVAHNGTTATSQVYGVVNTGANALATFSSTISGGNVNVTANTWSSTATATVFQTYMPV